MQSPYAIRWDKRDDYAEPSDCGWIGEDADGVWIARHPDIALAEHPRLWDAITEWQCGARDLTQADIDTMSSMHVEARCVLLSAQARAEYRRSAGSSDGG